MRNRYNHNHGRNNRETALPAALRILAGMAVLTVTVLGIHGGAVYAAQGERQEGESLAGIRSRGRVQYEYAVADADDFREIDGYISGQRNTAVGILNRLGTRFRQQSGEYTYDRNPDIGQEDIDITRISWNLLARAAAESQGVPAGLAVLNPEAALHIEGVEEKTDYYGDATEDNLSAGKAAWVDGRLLLGNGADNEKAYQKGCEDGEKGDIPEQLHPIYSIHGGSVEIRHAHVGSQAESEGISGCYHNYSVSDKEVISCDRTVEYLQPVWSPNENEPGGGTWHGGFYTCPAHGGSYDSPQICAYEKVIIRIGWLHDVICGLNDMLYARLTVRAADTGADLPAGEEEPLNPDRMSNSINIRRQIHLEAVLEEAEGYDRLVWPEGERLIWTDIQGNVLGQGPNLTVFEPGVYRCSIQAVNTDIDYRTAEAVVTVSGLMMTGN